VKEKLKLCLIGATGVGKTSLVARYAHSIFSERYATTIGVKIETKEVQREGWSVTLVLWDLSGEDEFQAVQTGYLRGAAACLIVVDAARPETLGTALSLEQRARTTTGDVPFVIALNKADLLMSNDIDQRLREALKVRELKVVRTSAKTGEGVEEAFNCLVDAIHQRRARWT
jgi:small GTP-binding protein